MDCSISNISKKDHTADIVVSCVVFPLAPLENITQ